MPPKAKGSRTVARRSPPPADVPARPQLTAHHVTLVQALLSRVRELTDIWTAYMAYVAMLTILGVAALQFARPETVVWIVFLLFMAMFMPLLERFLK